MAAVDKIEEKRKPEVFIGHRNRTLRIIDDLKGESVRRSFDSAASGYAQDDALMGDCAKTNRTINWN